jgi:hypothetical protein
MEHTGDTNKIVAEKKRRISRLGKLDTKMTLTSKMEWGGERSEGGIITMREKADDVGDDEMSLDISFPQFWYVEQIRSMP